MNFRAKLTKLESAVREKQEVERLAGRDYLEVIGEILIKGGFAECPRERYLLDHHEAAG